MGTWISLMVRLRKLPVPGYRCRSYSRVHSALESCTMNPQTTNGRLSVLPSQPTLWCCEHCGTLVSIRSAIRVEHAFCPACGEILFECCWTFESACELQFADA